MSNDAEPRQKSEGNMAFDTSGAMDRMVQQDLERIRAESLLALQDSAQELTRALDASLALPLALCELKEGLDRLEAPGLPSFSELEALMSSPESGALAMERNLLADLMRDGGETQTDLEERPCLPQAQAILRGARVVVAQPPEPRPVVQPVISSAPGDGDPHAPLGRPARQSRGRARAGPTAPAVRKASAGVGGALNSLKTAALPPPWERCRLPQRLGGQGTGDVPPRSPNPGRSRSPRICKAPAALLARVLGLFRRDRSRVTPSFTRRSLTGAPWR